MKNQNIKAEESKCKVIMRFGETFEEEKTIEFDTEKEMEAYLQGVSDMNGWLDYDYQIVA